MGQGSEYFRHYFFMSSRCYFEYVMQSVIGRSCYDAQRLKIFTVRVL